MVFFLFFPPFFFFPLCEPFHHQTCDSYTKKYFLIMDVNHWSPGLKSFNLELHIICESQNYTILFHHEILFLLYSFPWCHDWKCWKLVRIMIMLISSFSSLRLPFDPRVCCICLLCLHFNPVFLSIMKSLFQSHC